MGPTFRSLLKVNARLFAVVAAVSHSLPCLRLIFPKRENSDSDVVVTLPQKQIGQLIDQVSFAMAQQDVRVFLNGMLLEISENTLRAVATDGHRLAMASKPCQSNAGPGVVKQAIVPRKQWLKWAGCWMKKKRIFLFSWVVTTLK